MRRLLPLLVLLWALLAPAIGHSAAMQLTLGTKRAVYPPVGYVPWSTMGVVADGHTGGHTDNTAALNALSTASPIYGDCPAGGWIQFDAQWFWKSGFTFKAAPGCIIVTTFAAATDLGNASITQTDLTTPLDTVIVDGLYLRRLEPVSQAQFLHRSYYLNINHFKMVNWTIDVAHQMFYLAGSDVEIANGVGQNSCRVPGCDGIRQITNIPKVTSALKANWYVHDNVMAVGDAPYQACQPVVLGVFANRSSDDILYENNYGVSFASVVILIGEDKLGPTTSNVSCTNIVFRNNNGAGSQSSLKISSSYPGMVVQHITVDGATLSATAQTSAAVVDIWNQLGGVLDSVTLNNVHVVAPYQRSVSVIGPTHLTIQNSLLEEPVNGGLAGVGLNGDSDTVINANTIYGHLGAAIVVGKNATAPTLSTRAVVTNNILRGITKNQSGVLLQDSANGTVTGNTMQRKVGQTGTRGITYTAAAGSSPGTTTTVAHDNDVTNMNNNPSIFFLCNGSLNSAFNNAGSPNYSC